MSEDTTAAADPNAIFRMGTWIGKSFEEIESSGVFGERITPRVRQGSWNVPHRLDYAGKIGSSDPYETHIGFFENKETAYILFQKRSLAQGNTLNDAEVRGLLFKVASGGDWKEVAEGDQRPLRHGDENPSGPDFAGTFYEYSHTNDDTFRLFAFRLHNKKQLLIWPPVVTPNLFGSSFAPGSQLESFAPPGGGEEIELLEEPAEEVTGAEFTGGDPFSAEE